MKRKLSSYQFCNKIANISGNSIGERLKFDVLLFVRTNNTPIPKYKLC